MKKLFLILFCVFLAMPANTLFAADQDDCCETINQIMDDSAEEYRKMSQTIMKEYIKEPDTLSIEDCLSAINSINIGFSFGLPSLDELLQMACDFVKGQIESKLDEAASVIESQYSFSAYGIDVGGDLGVGTDGNSNVDFEVRDTSQDIVDSIWKSIQ